MCGKIKFLAFLVVGMTLVSMTPLNTAQLVTQQTSNNPTPITEPYDESGNTDNYIKIGDVEVIYGNFGDGDITTTAYQTSITLSDDNNDGMVETTVGVRYSISLPRENMVKHVLILFGIWIDRNNRAYGSGIATADSYGWNNGEFLTTFTYPTNKLSPDGTTFTTHVRGICAFGYDYDTAPFTVYLGTYGNSQNHVGFPKSIDVKICYPSGTVVANGVTHVTAGDNVGEYYLHTSNGESYRIDDTIPAYLVE